MGLAAMKGNRRQIWTISNHIGIVISLQLTGSVFKHMQAVKTRAQGTVTSTVNRGCRVGATALNATASMAPQTARAASFTANPPACPVKSL